MDKLKKEFGRKIKELRSQKNLTQEQLAEHLDISSRALSAIECGKSFVTAQTIEKICHILEITPKQLFNFDYEYKNKEDAKQELLQLISENEDQIGNIYKLVKAFLSI